MTSSVIPEETWPDIKRRRFEELSAKQGPQRAADYWSAIYRVVFEIEQRNKSK